MTRIALSSLYQQLILEHYRKPRNKGRLPAATVVVHMNNPVCGDDIQLYLAVDAEQRVTAATFLGHGCSISQASVSMMTVRLKGKTLAEGLALAERFTEMMHGSKEAASDRTLGELRALQGVSKFPVRIKCALLGFDALQEAAKRVRGQAEEPAGS